MHALYLRLECRVWRIHCVRIIQNHLWIIHAKLFCSCVIRVRTKCFTQVLERIFHSLDAVVAYTEQGVRLHAFQC